MLAVLSLFVAAAAPEAIDLYLDQRLDVIETNVSTVYAKGYDHSGRFWFVVDSRGRPIDAVDLSQRFGEDGVAKRLRARRHRWNVGGGALGVGGVVAIGVGVVVALPAVPFGAVGVAVGTVMLSRGLRERHPAMAYTQDEARTRVVDYNARLRDEILGPP